MKPRLADGTDAAGAVEVDEVTEVAEDSDAAETPAAELAKTGRGNDMLVRWLGRGWPGMVAGARCSLYTGGES